MNAILETKDSKYVLLRQIGNGGTCSVFKGISLSDESKKLYAIKIFKENAKKFFDKEILINKYLPPEYFIPIYDHGSGFVKYEASNESNIIDTNNFPIYNGKIFYEVEELADNGELFNYIYETKCGFSEKISAKIFPNL